MNCPKCNAVISDSSRFCVHCGAKIEKIEEKKPEAPVVSACVKCGAPLKPGAKFCGKCGSSQSIQTVTGNENIPRQTGASGQVNMPKQTVAPGQMNMPKQAGAPKQTSAPKQPKKKKSSAALVFILMLLFIVIILLGGFIVLDKVYDVNPIEVISEITQGSEKDGQDESNQNDEDDQKEKGDPELLDDIDDQLDEIKQLYDATDYSGAISLGTEVINQYVTVAEENNLKEEAEDGVEEAFSLVSKATVDYCMGIESQAYGSAGYEQVSNSTEMVLELAATLTEKGYEPDTAEIDEYCSGIIQRFKYTYIEKINEITEREQWSRDEAWTYAEQAYSIQKDGKTVLFDENDLDDPLRLRYVYCLAWILRKRCENGVADGSMTNEDAFNSLTAILEETDYNLLVLQDAITYGSSAGIDVTAYQEAYNAIIQEIKDEQNLSIVNSGVNSTTSVDLRKFWYFNDLDGDDAYKVDAHNGTTQATRDWIRNNIPSYLNR